MWALPGLCGARARRSRPASEIVLPKSVVDRLASGENPIRVLREWRDMTQGRAGSSVGITQGYLSDLEAGKRKGPRCFASEDCTRAWRSDRSSVADRRYRTQTLIPRAIAKRRQVIKGHEAGAREGDKSLIRRLPVAGAA